jgi:hypothetical protein
MTSPFFGLSLHVLCASDSQFWEAVDGYAFTWWQVAGPETWGLRS